MFKFNILEDVVAIRCEWLLGVENIFFCLTRLYGVIFCGGCIIMGVTLGMKTEFF